MLRIGMVISTPLPPREGIGFYAWNLSRYLTGQGIHVDLITRNEAMKVVNEVVAGVRIWKLPFLPLYPFHVHFHALFLRKLLENLQSNLDILHFHSPLVIAPKIDIPTLLTVHTPLKADISSVQKKGVIGLLIKLQAPISIHIEAELFTRVKKIVAVSTSVADELSAYGIGRNTIPVLWNGVDPGIFTPGNGLASGSSPYFFSAGRLGPRKGLEDLVECAWIVVQSQPGVRFYIAGGGPLKQTLRRLIVRYGLGKNVILLGHIPDRKEMAALYQGAAAFIHPAHYEGLPTVLLEAMACARPVIATAVSGALDVIEDGQNGLLVLPHAPVALATAVTRLLENPSLAGRLGEAALQTVRERYAWTVVGENYLHEYEELLTGWHGRG